MLAMADSDAPNLRSPIAPLAPDQRRAAAIAGRDARLPDWVVSGRPIVERPRYDSVIVVGAGIGGLCLAARLARSPAFAGRVTIVGKPPEQNPRLIGGLTLRARSLDYFAACLGIPRADLIEHLYGPHKAEVASNRQIAARFNRDREGRYEIGPTGEWMSRWDHDGRVLSYGVRNSHMSGAIYDFMAGLDIAWHSTKPASLDDCRGLARGSKPFVVVTEPMALPGAGGIPPNPKKFVVAAQLPFADPQRRSRRVLPDNTSMLCGRRRNGSLDASVWYPLRDPLSPDARYYGIFYKVVRGGVDLHRNAEIEVMKDNLLGVSAALGLEPVSPADTMGTAMIPCSDWRAIHEHTEGYLDLAKLANAGTPIICGDGMLRAGLAAYVAGEALIAGVEPQAHLNRAMRGWKWRNWLVYQAVGPSSWAGDASLRWFPGMGLNLIQNFGETWAGVE